MIILILMSIAAYLIEALLVGFALKWFIHRFHIILNVWKCIFALFIVFALNSLFYVLLLSLLDITFTVHNEQVASAMHLTADMHLDAVLALGLSDMLVWFLQALVAAGIALGIDTSPCRTEPEKSGPV